MDCAVITGDIGGQTAWSGDIENYTGYQFITGPELTAKFEEHLRKYNIALKENEGILQVKKTADDAVFVKSDKGEYTARALIIASGKKSRELGVPGEKEFKNHGLTYCATCDGPLFSGKDVAVIGGGNSALDAALQLLKIARRLYIVNISGSFTGDPVMQEQVTQSPLVTIFHETSVTAVLGEKMVSGLKIKRNNTEQVIPVQGVFVEIGLVPNSGFAEEVQKNDLGEIVVDDRNQTNIPGIFAAGDVTDVPEKQIIIAAGEVANAALSAFRYLIQHKFPS